MKLKPRSGPTRRNNLSIDRTEGSNEQEVVGRSGHILEMQQDNAVHKKITKKNGENEMENRYVERTELTERINEPSEDDHNSKRSEIFQII